MKRILCVDDDQEILDIYEIILLSEGYSVKTSIFPVDILQLILEFEPDLIILDINMNEINGLEVCREVRSYISNEHTPVIMISSDESIHTAVCDFGATAIILKPFQIDHLTETVKYHLSPSATVS
ncbi:response regulator [Paradesertivirga mongoliensis]|uniref:Response regulator n=1 Tax=Paradesertivirga mongoliensis TaxID=2100740 RepID=A0ABW4ZKD5_9SPHI|nr:response regulator [Pedobacter mongoliensis]